jgi:hypothetical protein
LIRKKKETTTETKQYFIQITWTSFIGTIHFGIDKISFNDEQLQFKIGQINE